MIGTQLGHYKILSQLGRGGMASVFKAEQAGLGRLVAIKILQPSLAADEVIVQRFQQEARIAANLHHAHVVTIYDVGEADGVYYIAMRFIDGENLGQLLRREGPLEPNRAMRMLDQVAAALDFAHSRGVLHRDIKPANVMVEPGDVLTLTDFGIARAGESSQLTATHMVIGTPEYMSPEQARGDPVDKRSDIYAMGVLMYEALGGRPPFSAASTPSLLYLHVHEPPPPLHQIRPDLPRTLSDVVVKALAKNPADRYGSAQELVSAAKAALAQPVQPPRPDPGPAFGATGAQTVFDPNAGRSRTPMPAGPTPGTPIPMPGTPVPRQPRGPGMPPGQGTPPGQGMPPGGPAVQPGGWGPQGQPAPGWAGPARGNSTSTLTPPPISARSGPYQPGPMHVAGTVSLPPKRSPLVILGPIIAALALVVVGGFVLLQSGLIGGSSATTATPTAVAAKPAAGATSTTAPAAQPGLTPTTAQAVAAKPADAPTAAPAAKPTEKPAEKPTAPAATSTPAPPPTPDAMARVTAAQGAVAGGDLPKAIAELRALRDDPVVKNDKATAALVDQTLAQTHILYGSQLLEQNKLDESYAQFAEALKLAPNDKEALDGQKRVVLTKNYAIMEANWGKDDDAGIKALEENMVLDANFKDTRQKLYALLLGKADNLLTAGNRDGAFPILMRALDVLPDGGEAQKRLATYTPTPRPQPQPQPQQPRPQPQPYQPQPQPQPQPQQPFRPSGSPV